MSVLKPEMLARLPALIVEDNKFMRTIIADLLRQIGFDQIHVAADGREGIEQFKTWLPKIVFTDWNMPEMDGVAFATWIRRSPDSPNPEVPIILITGNNKQDDVIDARNAGVTEFIAKPVNINAIQQRLGSALLSKRKFVRAPHYVGPCRRRRQNIEYSGDLRRLTDPTVVKKVCAETRAKLDEISGDVEALTQLAQSLDVTDRTQVREVRARTEDALGRAQEAKDVPISDAAGSLVGYIDAMGASGGLDCEVVTMHLAAMNRLIELADEQEAIRAKVVTGLKAVVVKRMNQAASA